MTTRAGWSGLLCLIVAALGVGAAAAIALAGNFDLGVLIAISCMAPLAIRQAAVVTPRLPRERPLVPFGRRQAVPTRVMCSRPRCGAMRPLWEMDWQDGLGPVCRRELCQGAPKEAA